MYVKIVANNPSPVAHPSQFPSVLTGLTRCWSIVCCLCYSMSSAVNILMADNFSIDGRDALDSRVADLVDRISDQLLLFGELVVDISIVIRITRIHHSSEFDSPYLSKTHC